MTNNIRYTYIQNIVLDLFKSNELYRAFPLQIDQIIQNISNCKIWSYSRYAEFHNISIADTIRCCRSKSGCTVYDQNTDRYLILFNNFCIKGRVLWTKAHELGHIKLNHFQSGLISQIAENDTDTSTNKFLDAEADFFAATLLSPFPLFGAFEISSPLKINTTFGLSSEASHNRWNQYLTWKKQHVKTAWENDMKRLFGVF